MNQSILPIATPSVSSSLPISRGLVDAIAMLAEQPHLRSKAGQIRVELQDGRILLNGNLPSYFLKQLAQETLRPLGLAISNRIRVG